MALEVTPLKNGTVVDHIPSGKGLAVLDLIGGGSASGESVLLLNVPSSTMGRKDIVKLEDVFVDAKRLDIIALVAPAATVNVIRNGKVSEKRRVSIPKSVEGHLKCLNPRCVSNAEREPLVPKFTVTSNSPVKLRCDYCDKEYDESLVLKI